jgi:pimeloyl-ACP methyl ester carboxylesterase
MHENREISSVPSCSDEGQSTRPPEMQQPPQNHPPLVRSVEAVRDLDAAVDFIRQRTGVSRVSLFGWATGGQWAGYYATLHSDKLSHLILLNALYGADAPHPFMGHGRTWKTQHIRGI